MKTKLFLLAAIYSINTSAFILPAPEPKPDFSNAANTIIIKKAQTMVGKNGNHFLTLILNNKSSRKMESATLNIYGSKHDYNQKYSWKVIDIPVVDAYNEVVITELIPPELQGKKFWIELSVVDGIENYYPTVNIMTNAFWDPNGGYGYFLPSDVWNTDLGRVMDPNFNIPVPFAAESNEQIEEQVEEYCGYEMLTTEVGAIYSLPAPGIEFVNVDALRDAVYQGNPRQVNDQFTHYNGHWRLHNGVFRCAN